MSDIDYRNVGREIPEKYTNGFGEKYKFKYNPSIWGFKRAEALVEFDMRNPIQDMLDEVLEPILSQLDPFKQYTMEIVNDTTIRFVCTGWKDEI